jgi:xylulokinase
MGVMLSAGGSLRWYRDALGESEKAAAAETGRDAYDILLEAAARVPPGSDGLLFLPYLSGERTPYPNPHARGVLFGLALTHTKAHLTRAVVEGVTFGLRDSLDLMRGLGVHVKEIRGSGGGARNPHWLQIMADVFGAPLSTVTATEGAAYGAALLGGVAAGVFPSVDEASRTTVHVSSTTAPVDPEAYTAIYRVYRSLYPALLRPFDELARIVDPSTTASGSTKS